MEKDEIDEKVASVLEPPPLIIKPRKTPLALTKNILSTTVLLPKIQHNVLVELDETQSTYCNFYQKNLSLSQINALDSTKNKLQLDIIPCITLPNVSQLQPSQSTEFLSPSPAVDKKSVGSFTPDDNSYLGLSKVNYDIDFSDLSADNSIVEELTFDKRKSPTPSFTTPDPCSPVGASCHITQSPLILVSVSFPVIEAKPMKKNDFVLPFLEDIEMSKTDETLDRIEEIPISLPSPLKSFTAEYMSFSKQGSKIPSIPCNTGHFTSLNLAQSSSISAPKETSGP